MSSPLELPGIEGPSAAQVYCPDSGSMDIWGACSNTLRWALTLEFLVQQVQGGAQELASSQMMLLLLVQGARFKNHWSSSFRSYSKGRLDDWFGIMWLLSTQSYL